MIKYTIITTLYNAGDYIYGLFKSLKEQKSINKKEFEVVIINDGSTDNTGAQVRKYEKFLVSYGDVIVINSRENRGQGEQRFEGAKLAKGKYLAFIDAKTRPNQDYLSQYLKLGHDIVIGNVYMDKDRSMWDRFNHILRVWLYKPYYGIEFEDIFLDEEEYKNFRLKGGGGAMWVNRQYFLDVNKRIEFYKYISDDSMIIGELSKIKPVLKSSKPKTKYLNRKGLSANIQHTFQRGPKFVGYYFVRGSRYYPYIIFLILVFLLNILLLLMNFKILIFELLLFIVMDIIFAFIISHSFRDFIVSFLLTPVFFLTFCIGNIYGIFLKLGGKLN